MIKPSIEAEQAVIGAMISEPVETVPLVLGELSEDDFLNMVCRTAYKAIRGMYTDGKQIDIVTVADRLNGQYVTELTNCYLTLPTTANIRQYIAIVRDAAKKERARVQATELMKLLEAGSVEECRELAVSVCKELDEREMSKVVDAEQGYLLFHENKAAPKQYLRTGFPTLDKHVHIDRGDYIVVGGRPSSGKTALTVQIAAEMSEKVHVAYFSLETSAAKIFDRIMANVASVTMPEIKRGNISEQGWEKIAAVGGQFERMKLSVVEASGWTVAQIQAKAVQLGADIIFVDYLGLVKGAGKSLYERVSNITNDLHVMAQQNKIAVVALCQLSRGGEGQPGMESLRESGAIEQDADAILLLHTPDRKHAERRELLIAKNKEGETGEIPLYFAGELQRFGELDTSHE